MQRLSRTILVAVVGLVAPLIAAGPAHAESAPQIEPDPIAKSDPDPEVVPSETGSYIVVMLENPLVATIGADDLDTPAAAAQADGMEATHDAVLADAGISTGEKIQDYTNALNGFAATLSYEQALKVASDARVALVLPDQLRQLTTDSSGDFLGLTGKGEAYANGLTGEGVVVGVIDSGIWPEHPSFADDGTYPASGLTLQDTAANPACNFGNTAHNPDDAPFTCNNKLVGARQMLATYRAVIGADPDEFDSARDDDGHGSHTAATAAGNAGVAASIYGKDYGSITGIAPRARVIAYKGLGNLGGFTSDLAASIDQAVLDGVDVINYSVGGGASALPGADDIAFLFAADAGVYVATSAGNSGPGEETIGSPANWPWLTTVGASTQRRFFEGRVTLTSRVEWPYNRRGHYRRTERFAGASVTPELPDRTDVVDAEFAGGDLCVPGTLDPALVTGKIVLCRRGAVARAAKSLAVAQAGGAGMVLYNNTDQDNLFTDSHFVPSVHVNNTDGLAIKEFIAENSNTTGTIRKTGRAVRDRSAPTMTYFSSRGANPTSGDIIKPDITAPGHQILAAASPFPDPGSAQPGELFQAISGTSMSSPHVAGVFALIKQAHPDWSAAAAKSAIMTSADRNVREIDGSWADPFAMGSGHLDPGRVKQRGSSFNPGLVYDAEFLDYLGFFCDAAPDVLSDASSTCAALESIGVPTDASDLNYPSVSIGELAGSQTIVRTVTSVANRTTTYWLEGTDPEGYDVHVSPSSFTIAPGESVTYEMTISNDGTGPLGEWRFGDFKWKSSAGYEVKSPIAVRGSAIDTPAAVSGSGTDGTTSFDIQFGYTGDYTAAPHGLVPETLLSGSVGQDPDQTYTPNEVSPGVVYVPFPLTDAAFARIELIIPGPDDIDLFLEDSAGNVVAQSTAGGTNELIELTLPANDDYRLVVHGWSVPSAPLAFDVSTWVVPLASGGSLSVDNAPAAAAIAESGTVDVSWSGLTAGGRYLGAVSHSDAAGLLGLTLVEVDS